MRAHAIGHISIWLLEILNKKSNCYQRVDDEAYKYRQSGKQQAIIKKSDNWPCRYRLLGM